MRKSVSPAFRYSPGREVAAGCWWVEQIITSSRWDYFSAVLSAFSPLYTLQWICNTDASYVRQTGHLNMQSQKEISDSEQQERRETEADAAVCYLIWTAAWGEAKWSSEVWWWSEVNMEAQFITCYRLYCWRSRLLTHSQHLVMLMLNERKMLLLMHDISAGVFVISLRLQALDRRCLWSGVRYLEASPNLMFVFDIIAHIAA